MEEFEKKAEQYQTIIEDLYAAMCELKQDNERLLRENDMLRCQLNKSACEDEEFL